MTDTKRLDYLISYHKERKMHVLNAPFDLALILILWYVVDNHIFAAVYLILYIISTVGYYKEMNGITDEIKYELNKMKQNSTIRAAHQGVNKNDTKRVA